MFGKYKLLKRLGAGGMAEVHLAEEQGFAGFTRLVVIKRILPEHLVDNYFHDMFINEARVSAYMCHPNLVQTFEFGRHADGRLFLSMEHVDGITAREWLLRGFRARTPLPWPAVATVIRDTLLGLHHAHEVKDAAGRPMGVVHRDISPANILIGKEGRTRVVDFGIARTDFSWTKTETGHFKGKPTYMPPEQFTGLPVDRRADVWAAAAVAYELLTGAPLVSAATAADALAAASAGPGRDLHQRRPDLPNALVAVIMSALHPQLEHRLRSAKAFAVALERVAQIQQQTLGEDLVATALDPQPKQRKPLPPLGTPPHANAL
ncbi:MAG: serine/threonine-protein kinase, partial [Myxococcota bacterium]